MRRFSIVGLALLCCVSTPGVRADHEPLPTMTVLEPGFVATVYAAGVPGATSLAFGPDGSLYVANGNSTDDGDAGGAPEVAPLSGSVLRVDVADAAAGPLNAMAYRGSPATPDDPVDVVATGMRNNYDLAFDGDDLYVAVNGPDAQDPLGEDTLVVVTDAPGRTIENAPDFGFPGCLYTHTGDGVPVAQPATTPNLPEDKKTCDGHTPAAAVFGLHVSADGLAFAPPEFGGGLFVAEFGNNPGPRFKGHKVVRVEDGGPVVRDFMSGIVPLDLTFHGGAMYVADFSGMIIRVVPVL